MSKISTTLSIFLLSVYASTHRINQNIMMDRNQLTYEVTSVNFNNGFFVVEGWGFIMDTQHYINDNQHQYKLILSNGEHDITINGISTTNSKTELMKYEGARNCHDNEYNAVSNTCNYKYEQVGFKFLVDMKLIETDKEYKMFLEVYANKSGKSGRIELYSPEAKDKIFTIESMNYQFNASYNQTSIVLNNDTVIARTSPGKESGIAKTGKSVNIKYINEIDTTVIGEFRQCFEAMNNDDMKSKACRWVSVIARKSYFRFINEWSIDNYISGYHNQINNILTNEIAIYKLDLFLSE